MRYVGSKVEAGLNVLGYISVGKAFRRAVAGFQAMGAVLNGGGGGVPI